MRDRVARILPSAFTLGGLLLACWSMTLAGDGRYEAAAWTIFAAGCADIFDGGLARLLDAISPFGKQLDSLVDLVAAGVAPGYLAYRVYFEPWGAWGVLVAFAWMAMVAIRLARFNTAQLVDGLYFVGVPCPIAAAVVAQYVVFSRGTFGDDGRAWVAAALIAVLGALLLSNVPYWKSATLLPGHFLHHAYGSGVVVTLAATAVFPSQAIFVGTAASIVVAAGLHTFGRVAILGLASHDERVRLT
jgi:CDP-diacylglycerol---serine O-phosphatidyltransferase